MNQQVYFNTTEETGQELVKLSKRNQKQNDVILQLFNQFNLLEFTAINMWNICQLYGHDFLLTSVRRSITTLHKSGKLIRLGKVKEVYGANNFKYKYNENI